MSKNVQVLIRAGKETELFWQRGIPQETLFTSTRSFKKKTPSWSSECSCCQAAKCLAWWSSVGLGMVTGRSGSAPEREKAWRT